MVRREKRSENKGQRWKTPRGVVEGRKEVKKKKKGKLSISTRNDLEKSE